MWRIPWAVACGLAVATSAQAVSIVSVSPQGEVAQLQQVTVKFSESVVPFGEPRLPDPMRLACTGNAPSGAGRWVDDRVWAYDFRQALPPGTRCTLTASPDWKPLGGALTGRSDFSFGAGGPAVLSVQPYEGSRIEEEQYFLLRLSGPAVEASVAANAWCEVQGIGERVPVRVIGGRARDDLLDARRLQKQATNMLVLACQRPLPAQTPMRLVWGKGIAAASNPEVLTHAAQSFRYEVRRPFLAEFSCERERAGAPCLPVLAMTLNFTAPVPRALAAQVRLTGPGGAAMGPAFDKDDQATEIQALRFAGPVPEDTDFTVELPADLKDNAGRPMRRPFRSKCAPARRRRSQNSPARLSASSNGAQRRCCR
jgi:hypothetical protein